MNLRNFVEELDSVLEENAYLRHENARLTLALQSHTDHLQESLQAYEQQMVGTLNAALDPDSAINRIARAVRRDPLKGAQECAAS